MKRKPVFNLYYKIFFALSFVSVVAVTLITLGQYAITRHALEKKSQDLNNSVVKLLMKDIDYNIYHIETIAEQVANYHVVSMLAKYQYSLSVYRDIEALTQLSSDLMAIKQLNGEIQAIAVYSSRNAMCIGTNGIRRLSAEEKDALVTYANENKSVKNWIVGNDYLAFEQADDFGQSNTEAEKQDTVKLVYKLNTYDIDPLCVVVTIDKYVMTHSIYDLSYDGGGIVILDGNRMPVTYVGCKAEMADEIVALTDQSEGNDFTYKNEKFFYVSGLSQTNQWSYVSFISQNTVLKDIAQLDAMIIVLIMLLAFFVVLLAIVAAKKIYRPVENFMNLLQEVPGDLKTDELSLLNSKVNHLISTIYNQNELIDQIDAKARQVHLENERNQKDNFIYQILNGEMTDHEEIEKACQVAHIDTERHFVVVGIHMAAGSDSGQITDSTQLDMLQEKTVELFETVAGKECQIIKCFVNKISDDMQGRQLICVLSLPAQQDKIMTEKRVQSLCEFFQSMLRSQCKADSYIGISSAYKDISQITKAYKQLQKVLHHEFVLGKNQVVSYRDTQEKDINIFSLDKKIRAFRSSLMAITDKETAAVAGKSLLEVETDFLLAVQYEYFCKEVISAVYDFVSQEVERNYDLLQEVITGFIRFDDMFHTYEDFCGWISQILQKAVELKDKRLLTSHAIVNRALKYVDEHYNAVISLSDVAESVGVSDSYLSKIFKEHVKISFKEYLTQLKMQKAKELLTETSLPIKEIGQMVGYNQTRQFSAIFTKLYGVTPSQYRRGVDKTVE